MVLLVCHLRLNACRSACISALSRPFWQWSRLGRLSGLAPVLFVCDSISEMTSRVSVFPVMRRSGESGVDPRPTCWPDQKPVRVVSA
jgi:hypothetical protein